MAAPNNVLDHFITDECQEMLWVSVFPQTTQPVCNRDHK